MCFTIYRSLSDGQWKGRLQAGNYEVIAQGEGYALGRRRARRQVDAFRG
jgi:uncharacterized protein YegP (UPF0339 family)